MKHRSQNGPALASIFSLAAILAVTILAATHLSAQMNGLTPRYKVLPAVTQGNLAVFPAVSNAVQDTSMFLTLDEGIREGTVVVEEAGSSAALVRPRAQINDGVLRQRPFQLPGPSQLPRQDGAQVNELSIINHSSKPLLLLAGEIVTGGKQDRVVGKDRIVPAHSDPIALSVFCVEPHRWTGTTSEFGTLHPLMAQPSVRSKAMANQNQAQVWDEVAKSRALFIAGAPQVDRRAMSATSSYADALQHSSAQRQIDAIAGPIETSYEKFLHQLREQKAVGAVVSVNGELIWADVFASNSLLEKYWPKLIRSYAAEAVAPKITPAIVKMAATQEQAQTFLDKLDSKHEAIESEPGLYRNTEITGDNFDVFVLTALLPNTGFSVHIAKMKRQQNG